MSVSEHKAWLKIERDALGDCVERLKNALDRKEGPEAGAKEWRAMERKLLELERTFHYMAEYLRGNSPNGCGSAEEELAAVRRRGENLGLMLTSFSLSLWGTAKNLVEEMRNCVCAAVGVPVTTRDLRRTETPRQNKDERTVKA